MIFRLIRLAGQELMHAVVRGDRASSAKVLDSVRDQATVSERADVCLHALREDNLDKIQTAETNRSKRQQD